ncbi:hypothetical protein ABT330_25620 [Streptomyces sp. NPDC000658]
MPSSPQYRGPDERRTRITRAVITGLLAGIVRALTGWLLEHLTGGN